MEKSKALSLVILSIFLINIIAIMPTPVNANYDIHPILKIAYVGDIFGYDKCNPQNNMFIINDTNTNTYTAFYYKAGSYIASHQHIYKYENGVESEFIQVNFDYYGTITAILVDTNYIYVITKDLEDTYTSTYGNIIISKYSISGTLISSYTIDNWVYYNYGWVSDNNAVGTALYKDDSYLYFTMYATATTPTTYNLIYAKIDLSLTSITTHLMNSEEETKYNYVFPIIGGGVGFASYGTTKSRIAIWDSTNTFTVTNFTLGTMQFDFAYPVRVIENTVTRSVSGLLNGRLTLHGTPISAGGMYFINYVFLDSAISIDTRLFGNDGSIANSTKGNVWAYHISTNTIALSYYKGLYTSDELWTATLSYDANNMISVVANPITVSNVGQESYYPVTLNPDWIYEQTLVTGTNYTQYWYYNNGYYPFTTGNYRIEYTSSGTITDIYSITGEATSYTLPSTGEYFVGGLGYYDNYTLEPNYLYYAKQPFALSMPIVLSQIGTLVVNNSIGVGTNGSFTETCDSVDTSKWDTFWHLPTAVGGEWVFDIPVGYNDFVQANYKTSTGYGVYNVSLKTSGNRVDGVNWWIFLYDATDELDIMEIFGNHYVGEFEVSTPMVNGKTNGSSGISYWFINASAYNLEDTNYHTITCDYSATNILIYIDNNKIYNWSNDCTNKTELGIPLQPMEFMIGAKGDGTQASGFTMYVDNITYTSSASATPLTSQMFTFCIFKDNTLIYSENVTMTYNGIQQVIAFPNIIVSTSATIRYGLICYQNMTIGKDVFNPAVYKKPLDANFTFTLDDEMLSFYGVEGTYIGQLALKLWYYINLNGVNYTVNNNSGGITAVVNTNGSISLIFNSTTPQMNLNGSAMAQPSTAIGTYLNGFGFTYGIGEALGYIIWTATILGLCGIFAVKNALNPMITAIICVASTFIYWAIGIIPPLLFFAVLFTIAGFGSIGVVNFISKNRE